MFLILKQSDTIIHFYGRLNLYTNNTKNVCHHKIIEVIIKKKKKC